jgi:hypothetical protein
MGGSIHTKKKNRYALVIVSKEIGLEVNTDITKYMVMSRDQNAGRSHSTNINNNSYGRGNCSNIWVQQEQIKILFRKKLRAD